MFTEKYKHHRNRIYIELHEGMEWPNGEPRATLTVEVGMPLPNFSGDEMQPCGISWPATSDRRPQLAAALGRALIRAAQIANEVDVRGQTMHVAFPYREGDPVIGDGGVPFEIISVNPDGSLDLAALETAAPRLVAEEVPPTAVRPNWKELV